MEKIDQYEYSSDEIPVLIRHSQYESSQSTPMLVNSYVYELFGEKKLKRLKYKITQSGSVTEYQHNERGLIESVCLYLKDRLPLSPDNDVPTCERMSEWKQTEVKNPSQVKLTGFTYTQEGQVQQKIDYSAVLANGKGDATKPYRENKFESYDVNGNPQLISLRTGVADNAFLKTHREFDGLNRIVSLHEGTESKQSQQTRHEYIDNKIVATSPNGQQESSTFDVKGLLSKDYTALKEMPKPQVHFTSIDRDSTKNIIITKTAGFNAEYTYKDDVGRVVGFVGKSGQVVKTEYNETNRYKKVTAFAKKLDLADIDLKQGLVLPATTEDKDRETYTFYGLRNEIHYEVDAEGYLTEYRYHLNGDISHVICYADAVTPAELNQLKSGGVIDRLPDRNKDRIHSKFYDIDGVLQAEQDGAGYITEYVRDAGSRIVNKITYAVPVLSFTNNYQQIKPVLDEACDAVHYYFYNNLNECELEVDAMGCVIKREFELDGNIKSETQLYHQIKLDEWADREKRPNIRFSDQDRLTSYEYDELRRKQKINHPNGAVSVLGYDEMNHQTSKVQLDSNDTNSAEGDAYRGRLTRFNKLGQVIATLNEFATKKLKEIEQNFTGDEAAARTEELWQKSAERYEYNIYGLKVRTIDALGKITKHYYDLDQHPIMDIDATGAVIERGYNAFGEVIKETHYINRISQSDLENLGGGLINDQIKSLIKPDDTKDHVIIKERNKRGLIQMLKESEQRFTKTTYNAFKQPKLEEIASDEDKFISIEHGYEGRGLETTLTKSADGEAVIKHTTEYNHPLGLETAKDDACGGREEYVRNKNGGITEVKQKDENGELVTMQSRKLDAFLRPYEITDADQSTVNITYNGRIEETLLADGVSKRRVLRNAFNQVINTQIIDANNEVIFESSELHAADGQIEKEVDGVGNTLKHILNNLGLEESTILQNQAVIEFGYNDAHVKNKIISDAGDQEGKLKLTQSFEIDALKRKEKITDGRNITEEIGYTPQGECLSKTRQMEDGKPDLITRNVIKH